MNAAELINPAYAAKLEIRQTTSIYQTQVDAGENPSTYFTKVMMFDRMFDHIKQTHFQHWSSDLEIALDSARLYLYAFTFMCSAPTGSASALRASAQHYLILQKAQAAASQLVQNLTDLSLSSSPNSACPAGLLTFSPKYYFTNLFFAAVFLFRILISGQAVLSHSRTDMVSSLQAAHKIFQSFPQHRDHTRAAINIEILVQILRDGHSIGRNRLDSLVISNRFSASLMYDSIFRAGEERNRQQNSRSASAVVSWKTMSDQFPERLPHVPRRPSAPSSTAFRMPAEGALVEDNPEWWTSWDAYMEDFGIGLESFPLT